MENIEIGVFDPSSVKIGRGEGSSMKRGGVLSIALAVNADKMSVFVDTPVADIPGHFHLSFLVEEDDGVEVRLSTVIPYPPFARVVRVLKVASKWWGETNGLRGGSRSGDGGLVLSEADGFVTVDTVVIHVRLSEVENTRNEE